MWVKSLLGATALTAAVPQVGAPAAPPVQAQEVEGIIFNGVDPFGERTNIAGHGGVFAWDGSAASLQTIAVRHASLASQAVGPPLSDFEMSCAGRIFADIENHRARRLG
jgi:cytochrome c peroxidase